MLKYAVYNESSRSTVMYTIRYTHFGNFYTFLTISYTPVLDVKLYAFTSIDIRIPWCNNIQ